MTALQRILEAVEKETGLDIANATGRQRHIVDARKIYAYIARNITNYSLYEIGRFINKNHATIIHYERCTKELVLHDIEFAEMYHRCLKRIGTISEDSVLRDAYKYHSKRSNYYLKQINNLLDNG